MATNWFVRFADRHWNGNDQHGNPIWNETPFKPEALSYSYPDGDKRIAHPDDIDSAKIPHNLDHNSVFWHGSASDNETMHGPAGLHFGTYHAARDALANVVGHKADNTDWDGTTAWGDTPQMGQRNRLKNGLQKEIDYPWHQDPAMDNTRPLDDYVPSQLTHPAKAALWGTANPTFAGGDVSHDFKPNLFPVKLKPETAVHPHLHSDDSANNKMESHAQDLDIFNHGQAQSAPNTPAMFYINKAEDKGSVSGVVPHHSMIERVDPTTVQKPESFRHALNDRFSPNAQAQIDAAQKPKGNPWNKNVWSMNKNSADEKPMGSMERNIRKNMEHAKKALPPIVPIAPKAPVKNSAVINWFVRMAAPTLRNLGEPLEGYDTSHNPPHPDYTFKFHPHDPETANPSHVPVDQVQAFHKDSPSWPVATLKLQAFDNGDNRPRGLINWVGVEPEHKGKNLGSAMLQHAVQNGQTPIHDDWNGENVSESGAEFIDRNRAYPMLKNQYLAKMAFFVRTSDYNPVDWGSARDLYHSHSKLDFHDLMSPNGYSFAKSKLNPLSKANPLMLNADHRDDWQEHEDTQNHYLTHLASSPWQETFTAARGVRRSAWDLMGKSPNKSYTADPHIHHNNYERAAPGAGEDDQINQPNAHMAYAFMHHIHNTPNVGQEDLYRMVQHPNADQFVKNLRTGNTFNMPLASFASGEAPQGFGSDLQFHLMPGHKTVKGTAVGFNEVTDEISHEHIAGGKFRIAGVEKGMKEWDDQEPSHIVHLQHIGTTDPDPLVDRKTGPMQAAAANDPNEIDISEWDHLFDGPAFPGHKDGKTKKVEQKVRKLPKTSARWNYDDPNNQLSFSVSKAPYQKDNVTLDGYDKIQAHINGKPVGHMLLAPQRVTPDSPHGPGEIADVQVHQDFRGQGLAREMAYHAQENDLWPKHSDTRTPDGDAFARATPELGFTRKRGKIASNEDLSNSIRDSLTDDLLKPEYRNRPDRVRSAGHCYAASEAAYHMLGGKAAGWTPMQINHEGDSHWFLKHNSGEVLDATADQFKTPVPYDNAVGRGFLTAQPSKRAKTIIDRVSAPQKISPTTSAVTITDKPIFVRTSDNMTQPSKPQFVRTTPTGNQLSSVPNTGADLTGDEEVASPFLNKDEEHSGDPEDTGYRARAEWAGFHPMQDEKLPTNWDGKQLS